MSDCEETDFFWESWTLSGKRKRKKDSKKDRKCLKNDKDITMKTDEKVQKKKKKKNSKFKDAMEGMKTKRKEKKKKKNRLALELDDNFMFTQPKPALHPRSNDTLKPDHLTQDSTKRTKRKKKVAFDLSPAYICVKRPHFSSQQSPKESILSETEAVRHSESCPQVTATEHSRDQTHDNDSQCTSDDTNSQDLFITQKTFRASPPDPSSGEASDKAFFTTPQMFTQRDKRHTPVAQVNTHRADSPFQQHHRKTIEHVQKPKTVQALLTEEEEGLKNAHQNPKKGQLSFQTQTQFNTKLTEEKKASRPAHIKPSVVNPYLNEPVVASPSIDVTKLKKHSCTSSQQSPSCLQHTDEPSVLLPPTSSTSTQTENFFTTERSSYLNFCLKSRTTVHDLKPLDLSLNQRARKDPGTCLSARTSSSSGENKDPNLRLSLSTNVRDVEVKKDPAGRHVWSTSTRVKGERALSPQSESVDTTTSSEDNEPPCRTGKLDMAQVRAVQMRLNESFFFKSKGERQSPRSASPLMKLAQSREVKSGKGH